MHSSKQASLALSSLAAAVLGLTMATAAPTPAAAQTTSFPTREIELVVPFSPGGSTDAMARMVAPKVSEYLGVPVTVVNKPGGSAIIGTNYVLSSSDGYRVATGGNSNVGTILAIGKKTPFSLDDVAGLARGVTNTLVIVAKKGRFENFQDLAKAAKDKPGSISFASWGNKTPSHFYVEMLAQQLGTKVKHIAFDGGAKAMVAAMGGHVDAAVVTVTTAKTNIQAGNLVALAVTSEERAEALPEVPSIKEAGLPEAVYVSFDGFITGSKVPADRLEMLQGAFAKALNDPQIQAELRKTGSDPAYLSGAAYDAVLRSNLKILRETATKAGIED